MVFVFCPTVSWLHTLFGFVPFFLYVKFNNNSSLVSPDHHQMRLKLCGVIKFAFSLKSRNIFWLWALRIRFYTFLRLREHTHTRMQAFYQIVRLHQIVCACSTSHNIRATDSMPHSTLCIDYIVYRFYAGHFRTLKKIFGVQFIVELREFREMMS